MKLSDDALNLFFASKGSALDLPCEGSFDDSLKMQKEEYQKINPEASGRSYLTALYELAIFRTYQAKFLVAPKLKDFDFGRYMIFGDPYYDECNKEAEILYDRDWATARYNEALGAVGEKDYFKAGHLFYESAIEGNVSAQFNYGVSVENGEVGTPDLWEGAFWYWIAAQGGNAKAMSNLGICYRRGQGVSQNGWRMLYWYAKSAQLLMPSAVRDLGLSLRNEEVITGNSALGNTLCQEVAYRMDEPQVQEYVQGIAGQVIDIAEGQDYII